MRSTARSVWPALSFSTLMIAIAGLLGCAGSPLDTLDGEAQPPDMASDMSSPGTGPDGPTCATVCAGQCVDPQNDPKHCGSCDKACGAMETCQKGVCTPMTMTSNIFCNQPPPPGAMQAPPPPKYSGGTCPNLVAGENMITSIGNKRTFRLAVPKDLKPGEYLPVVFLWYWLRGSSESFLVKGEVQAAVDTQRFLAVLPDAKGDLFWNWPFAITDNALRQLEEDFFFEDMLSCVSQQFNVNRNCVASAGVSAGALFTDQLASDESKYLASAMSLSGGVGGGLVKPWGNPQHKLPMLILWGGPLDLCIVIAFQQTSQNLEMALVQQGNFFLECIHNCKHGEPPFDPPPGLSKYAGLWRFVFDHPYWLAPGDSPYKKTGIPAGAGYPSWCGIGMNSAVPRTGACPPPGC